VNAAAGTDTLEHRKGIPPIFACSENELPTKQIAAGVQRVEPHHTS
jgi:hypothetical protein